MPLFGSLILLSGAAAVALVIYLMVLASVPNRKQEGMREYSKEEMKEHLLWKSFYVNPDDPRTVVPKTWGYGWTVNFRTNGRAYVFAGMIALCVGLSLAGCVLLVVGTM